MTPHSLFISTRRRRRNARPLLTTVTVLSLVVLGGWMLSGAEAARTLLTASERPLGAEGPTPPLRPPASFTSLAGWPPRLERPPSAARRVRSVRRGTGELRTVPGTSPRSGSGPLQLYAVEVEGGLGISPRRFAAAVERTLADRRGWRSPGVRAFRRADEGAVAFRVTLASPATTDRLCAPLQTNRRYSCYQAGRAVLNAGRWMKGTAGYRGRLAAYRRYMVNHEVGHGLGRGHSSCPRRGARAPVMLQQTKGLGGCRPGPWPLDLERGGAG